MASASSSEVKAIDKRTVHQICSGQVVLSLAVAVKELVENSLDAGATCVEVKLKDHGLELVEVADNGSGVAPANFAALTLKHHTSKLSEFDDLLTVSTFGFRGEALSSLCALSDLVVTTCHRTQSVATRIEYDSNGHIKSQTNCAREVGTTISLHNLFHSLPVRCKEFQRNIKKEFSRMVQMLQGYCLISTGVRISCCNHTGKGKRQVVLATSGGSSVKENIVSVFGQKQLQLCVELRECEREEVEVGEGEESDPVIQDALKSFRPEHGVSPFCRLAGYVSRCAHGSGRSTVDRQYYYCNGRPFELPRLSKTVNEVYHTYNRHQSPFVVLDIQTRRDHVDVNVTPDKRKVILQQEKALLLLVKGSLHKIYRSMQGEYEATSVGRQPGPGILASGDQQVSPEVPLHPPPPPTSLWSRLPSLKRPSSHEDSENGDLCSSSPRPKQPKLLDYGIEKREHGYSHETRNKDEESFNHRNKSSVSASPLSGVTTTASTSRTNDWLNSQEKTTESCAWQGSCDRSKTTTRRESAVSKTNVGSVREHTVCCDVSLISQRLRAGLGGVGEGKGGVRSRKFRARIKPDENQSAEQELRKQISKTMFERMHVIGQFNLGFIITRLDTDIFIIDQHATDEKYNYERLQREAVIDHQKLIQPKLLELTAVSENIILDNLEMFRMNGFHFHIDHNAAPTQRLRLTSQPVYRGVKLGTDDR
ncbi:Mismatch repair endonuclease PMS2 [Geodia barretti]|uniref:Mismatch repair endonuclease PMS2 n=1 Tax=Geodia barretti TaxID=519541 RepID=A0AA35R9R0_GEOBA|nr:Mismatch repair endonuclease PMS2 [Geodia barretti]